MSEVLLLGASSHDIRRQSLSAYETIQCVPDSCDVRIGAASAWDKRDRKSGESGARSPTTLDGNHSKGYGQGIVRLVPDLFGGM